MSTTKSATRSIGSITSWLSGGTPNRARAEYWRGNIPWISASTLKQPEISTSNQWLTPTAVSVGSKMAPVGATLLLVRGSALHNEIRVGMVVAPVAFNQDVKALIPKRGVVPKYLTHVIRANESRLLQLVTSAGNTAGVLDTTVVQAFEVLVPSEAEQAALVTVLDNVDKEIESIERLIAKKLSMQQGLMQQLLAGRIRLPGFFDGWTAVTLHDVGATYGGLTGKDKDDFGKGNASYVTFMEVMAGARLRGNRLDRVRVRHGERQNRVLRGDVLFNGSSETPEEVALAAVVDFDPAPSTYLNSFCFGYRLRGRGMIDPAYLAYFFRSQSGRDLVSALAQGATRYNIAKTKLMQASPLLPPVDEQRAIVKLLRGSEEEIGALKDCLRKARDIKTGMMQQLLTGRTRLSEAVAR